VDDYFDRHRAGAGDAGELQIPVRPWVDSPRLLVQPGGDGRGDSQGSGLAQADLASVCARRQAVNAEVHQVASAVAHVAATLVDSVYPCVVIQFALQLDVGPAFAHSLAGNAG